MKEEKAASAAKEHRVLSAVLALLMVLAVTVCALGWVAGAAMNSRELYRGAADALLPVQAERLRARVEEIAQEVGFDPECVMPLLGEETLRAEQDKLIAWWTDSLSGTAQAAPDLSIPGLEEAILADETFIANVSMWERSALAREKGAAGIDRAVRESLLPLRLSVISSAMNLAAGRLRLPRIAALVRLLPLAALGLALLFAVLLAIVHRKSLLAALRWIGAGLAGGGLAALSVIGIVRWMDPQAMVATVSVPAAELAGSLLGRMAGSLGLCGVVFVAAGFALIAAGVFAGRSEKA